MFLIVVAQGKRNTAIPETHQIICSRYGHGSVVDMLK